MSPDALGNRLDDCGVCTLLPTVTGTVRAEQATCPVHGTWPYAPRSAPSASSHALPGSFLTADALAARDARIRAEIAEDIAQAIESHHAADNLTAIQSARIARYHATQYDDLAAAASSVPTGPADRWRLDEGAPITAAEIRAATNGDDTDAR